MEPPRIVTLRGAKRGSAGVPVAKCDAAWDTQSARETTMRRKSLNFETQHAHGGYEAQTHGVRITMAQTVIATITIRNERLNGIMCMANILLQDIPQVPSMRRDDLQKSTTKFPKLPQQIPVPQKTTVEMQDARWDRMTGI